MRRLHPLAADIAVGNVGSEPSRSTVLIRTQAGLDAWRVGSAALHATTLADLNAVARATRRNRRHAEQAMPRPFDPSAGLWISHPEHLATYADTERAPVGPPAHRSHHYNIGC